ncbi:MAG TPA: hypothetical protein VGQ76_01065, partial [Thermoanaerobaculia bacterium]|nr:hypothetical protein [Thermoanaerobaculia bacterium]
MRTIQTLIALLFLAASANAQDPAITNVAPSRVKLGDFVVVTVSDYAKMRGDAAAAGKPVTLFLNGIDTGTTASFERPDEKRFDFVLTRTSENLPLWRTLLREPFGPDTRNVTVSVGIQGGAPLARATNAKTNVELLKKRWSNLAGIAWLIFFALVVAGLLYFAKDMLKNEHNEHYSLGRTQLAWWFVLILGSYLFIWLLT